MFPDPDTMAQELILLAAPALSSITLFVPLPMNSCVTGPKMELLFPQTIALYWFSPLDEISFEIPDPMNPDVVLDMTLVSPVTMPDRLPFVMMLLPPVAMMLYLGVVGVVVDVVIMVFVIPATIALEDVDVAPTGQLIVLVSPAPMKHVVIPPPPPRIEFVDPATIALSTA